MRALLSQELPDEAAVMQQADAIGALELAERKNRLQAILQIRAVLTPAQRQELIRRWGELHSRRRSDLTQACQADSANLCPEARRGRALMQCLHNHLDELSETCRTAIQTR
jgi:Spy/CpxP family protein refolding chaperone